MRVLRAADALRQPWRNGGGWTRELLRLPEDADDYDWRLSVADVEQDGAFSRFDLCDRILVLLAGAGMRLLSGGEPVTLRGANDHLRFAGELPVIAELLDGPTTDLNLIWRRDRCTVTMVDARPPTARTIGGGPQEIAVAVDLGTVIARVGEAGECLSIGSSAREIGFVIAPLSRA